MEEYNAKHGTNQLWSANIFRGFDAGPKGDNEWERREAEKEEDRKHKVNFLHEILSKQTVYTFDKETIRQDLEYDPNRDTSVEALIMDGFHQMRVERLANVSTTLRFDHAIKIKKNVIKIKKNVNHA